VLRLACVGQRGRLELGLVLLGDVAVLQLFLVLGFVFWIAEGKSINVQLSFGAGECRSEVVADDVSVVAVVGSNG